MTNCVKSFWFIKCSNSNSSRHNKNPKNSAANVRISEVREDLKQFCKVRAKTRFLQVIIKQILYRLSSPYYSLDVSLQQLGKQDSFEHILKKSAMCDNSDLQFSRTTTGIQTGPDASKKSKAIVNCLMIKLSRAINCHYLFIFCMLIMYLPSVSLLVFSYACFYIAQKCKIHNMVQRLAGYWRNLGHSFPVEPAKPVHIMAIFTINDFIVYHYNYRPTEYQSFIFFKTSKM